MCGIFCSLTKSDCEGWTHALALLSCLPNLQRRGPDLFQMQSHDLLSGYSLLLASSVLQTQGEDLCPQPYSDKGNILCWNGDVFDGPLTNEINQNKLSDTEVVYQHLSNSQLYSSPPEVLTEIVGPYSFIFFNKKSQVLWFGRDPAGRHSLLYGFSQPPLSFLVSSVAHSGLTHLQELPALGVYEINLKLLADQTYMTINLYPWEEITAEELNLNHPNLSPAILIKPPICRQYIFRPLPFKYPVTDENTINSVFSMPEGLSLKDKLRNFLSLEPYKTNMKTVLSLLEKAVQVRVKTNVHFCQSCPPNEKSKETSCAHPKVAVLFSGGLDSAILARLVDKFVPDSEPIDLLNVAFEKKTSISTDVASRQNKSGGNTNFLNESGFSKSSIYDVPDRISGRKTLEELQFLCPQRKWNFIEVDVPLAELQEERSHCISHLIHPLKTILDDSLGCALWFAARGQGKVNHSTEEYKSPARIIITGMGADEQFGGYMRHRTTLKNSGWEALHDQLQMELKRIPSRNLGRDDRVVSHHGRQPRMPFLDEELISFVKCLPPWEKCCPNDDLPSGLGDKLLLRLVAWHIGLEGAALLPKRALQFGSRIANSKENAAHTSERL